MKVDLSAKFVCVEESDSSGNVLDRASSVVKHAADIHAFAVFVGLDYGEVVGFNWKDTKRCGLVALV